jgi:hypothetical protein
VLKNRI